MAGPLKGRGTLSNPPDRFARTRTEAVDDGWFIEEAPDRIATTVQPDRARSIINTNDSPDIPFEQSVNPYRGCEHGCVWCFARPSHAYLGLSPGLDFETKLFFKQDAAQLLTAELSRPGYVCKPITLGANTDPYQPVERQLRVTRGVLEVLERTSHPVSIITKSTLILRDLELLAGMARHGLVQANVSITSLDLELKRCMEPRAASPRARLEVVRQLSSAGIPVSVLVAPVIPVLTDHELERILEAAVRAGAGSAGYVVLRLPHEVKDLFREWLATHYPLRARRVMSIVQSLRGGRDNDPRFGLRMRGTGPFAGILELRFRKACERLGLSRASASPLHTGLFRRPGETDQLDLGL